MLVPRRREPLLRLHLLLVHMHFALIANHNPPDPSPPPSSSSSSSSIHSLFVNEPSSSSSLLLLCVSSVCQEEGKSKERSAAVSPALVVPGDDNLWHAASLRQLRPDCPLLKIIKSTSSEAYKAVGPESFEAGKESVGEATVA